MVTEVSRGDATHHAHRATEAAEPEGWYPDPVDGAARRFWDGEAWTHRVERTEAAEQPAPHWKRHAFSFFTHRWFHVLIAGVVIGVGGSIVYTEFHNIGIVAVTAFLSTCTTTTALGLFVAGRLRLGEVMTRSEVITIAVIGGAVGFVFAGLLEWGVSYLVNEDYMTGPIEETGKLIVPLTLYALGRYRDPRAGLVAALASAAGFGILEATTHPIYIDIGLFTPPGDHGLIAIGEAWSLGVIRPFVELIHMFLTGFIAAVAWRTWHLRGGFCLTWGVVGAILAAWVLHSTNDTLGVSVSYLKIVLLVGMYFAFKESARQLTPPEAIRQVPPGWRPRWLHKDPEPTTSTALATPTGMGSHPIAS